MKKQNILGEEKISKLLLKFSIPAIIGMLVNALYNVVDRIFIGNIPDVGGIALTGVGLTMPIMTIILAFGMLIGIGTSARISLKLGEGKKDEAEKHIGNAFILILIISAAITILGLIFLNPILNIFAASPETEGYARDYMGIIFAGTIFSMMSFGLNHSIRSDGSPRIAMHSMLIGAIINIILDPVFIFTFNMGVKGAAIATVISQIASTIWVVYYFTKGKSNIKIKKENLKLDRTIIISIFSIGMSPFSMQVAQSVVQVLANNALKEYGGDLAIGAMTIINSIAMMFLMPIFGLNQGSQPLIGYNYGAKKYDRVKQTVKYAAIAATIMVTLGWAATQAVPELFIKVFNSDPELIDIGKNGLRIFLFMLPVIGFQVISSNYFQSIGKAKVSMFLSLLRQVILMIPCMIILPKFFGLNGVWLSGPVCDSIASVITGIMFYRSVKRLGKEKSIDQVKAIA
ncbi:MATE family efflux transporter [Clostridium vincentii]|uniref:Multidrug export protein MepA n=1 Tax=Clostridium vincentii TaxID=52704 RepID=A0A2T0BHB8_9CLOT|nr:MATE family efflux transporter [Clostridium vincentii]PRR83274.1 Multidrug export protein MepA [Clostridium vincentii]